MREPLALARPTEANEEIKLSQEQDGVQKRQAERMEYWKRELSFSRLIMTGDDGNNYDEKEGDN